MSDVVAVFEVPLCDNLYFIELEHGTTSGKRVIRVNDKEVVRKNFLFKLVGSESFEIGQDKKVKCEVIITSNTGFSYQYKLMANGENLVEFKQKQQKKMVVWYYIRNERRTRISLDKDTMEVWVNGKRPEVDSIFIDEGTEMVFSLTSEDNKECSIKVVSSGKKREGIIYNLFVNNHQIRESVE